MKFCSSEINLNNSLQYFSIKLINHKIILNKNNPFINNIICDNYYVNFDDFKLENNKVMIKYSLVFKILYSSLENNKTYTIKDNKIGYMAILLPNKINGEFLKSIFSRKGFSINFIPLNTSIINFQKNYINTYLTLLAYIDILKIHSIAYIIKFSNFEENIYTSLFDGKDLIQKSFELNKKIKKLHFSHKNNDIFYLEDDVSSKSIKKFSLESEELVEVYTNTILKNFEILDDKNIILLLENISDSSLILFNIETFKYSTFYRFYDYKSVFFKISSNLIIIILIKGDKKFLNLINTNGNLIYEIEGDFFYSDVSPCGKFLILMEKTTLRILFLNSLESYSLNKNLIDENFSSFKFLNSKKILLHTKNSKKEYLIILNLSNNKKETLVETGFKIIDFSIDYEKNIIYYVLKSLTDCRIFTINNKREIENLVNLDAKSLSLLVRS